MRFINNFLDMEKMLVNVLKENANRHIQYDVN